MDIVDINLYDAEKQQQYQFKLSAADALRAQTDMSFATALLNVARQNNSNNNNVCFGESIALPNKINNDACFGALASQSSADRICTLDNNSIMEETDDTAIDTMLTEQNDNNMSEDSLGEGFRWSHAAVLLLLEEYRLREKDMSSGKITHKRAWDQISKEMIGKGYFVSGKQCSTRINTMKRTYKVVKDHNGKSGNNKRTWPYYDIMESLLGKKPYMAPLSTLSSSGAETSNSSCSSPISCTVAADDNNHVLRKHRINDIATSIIESRTLAEKGRDRRHEESMTIKKKLLDKLDIIIANL